MDRDGAQQPRHHIGFADDVLEGVALLERSLELNDLLLRTLFRDRRAYVRQQLLVIPRFLDEVFRTCLQSVHHIAHGAIGGDHDHGNRGLQALDPRQQLDTALARQRQIQQDQVILSAGQQVQAGIAILRQVDRKAFEVKQSLKRVPYASLVVDNEQMSL